MDGADVPLTPTICATSNRARHAHEKMRAENVDEAIMRAQRAMQLVVELLPRMAAKSFRKLVDSEPVPSTELRIISDSTKGSGDGVTEVAFGVMFMGYYGW